MAPEVTARIKILQDSAERLQKDADRTQMQIQTTTDLLEVLSSWGQCENCPADLNGDGVVSLADLLIVLTNWS